MATLTSVRRRGGDDGAREVVATPEELAAGPLAPADVVGLYVHFPFCSVHCPYCDFAVDARAEIPHERYADAVVAEIAARAPWFGGGGVEPRLVSIYFGGGTPGLWRPEALARVIAAGRAAFGDGGEVATSSGPIASLEITVEANPGEVDDVRATAWRAAGVNRVSLGVQALDDRLLVAIGRNHDAASAACAVQAVRAAGIDNLSLDLMFGLPGQTMDDWRRTVDQALALGAEHVSAYALTIERGTPFGARARRGERLEPEAELAAAMQEHVRDALGGAGFAQYEVSSYARRGRQAVHNSLYWSGAPYLGAGASASSFRPLADGTGWRFSNPRATETYLRAVKASGGATQPAQTERRTADDLENEAVWLALRTTAGLDRARHAARFGRDPLVGREREVSSCVEAGWLRVSPEALGPTPAGLLFADEIAARLWR